MLPVLKCVVYYVFWQDSSLTSLYDMFQLTHNTEKLCDFQILWEQLAHPIIFQSTSGEVAAAMEKYYLYCLHKQPVLSVYYIFYISETFPKYFIDGYQCLEYGFDGWERGQDSRSRQHSDLAINRKCWDRWWGCQERMEYFSEKLSKYTLKADYKLLKIRISKNSLSCYQNYYRKPITLTIELKY